TGQLDRLGRGRAFTSDAYGRLVQESWYAPDGTLLWGGSVRRYDAQGNLLYVVKADGPTTSYGYVSTFDALNRLTSQAGPFQMSWAYEYQLTRDGFPEIWIHDPLDGLTVSGYDAGNRLAYKYLSDATNPYRVDLGYNLDNQLTTVVYSRAP